MTSSKPGAKRLFFLQKLPVPAFDTLFRALHESRAIDLQVFHLWSTNDRRPWKSQLGQGYPNHYMAPKLDLHCLQTALQDKESLFVVGDWGNPQPLALVMARLARRAPVALWVDTPQEHLPRPAFKKAARSAFLRWLLRRVDLVFATGAPARRVLRSMGAPDEKIVDFPVFVSLDQPKQRMDAPEVKQRAADLRRRVGCEREGLVMATVGTIDFAKKAQDFGLRAFAKARQQSKLPLGLLVAGAGKELPLLERMVRELNLESSVALLGWQEPEDMEAVYSAMDVLVHPAHYDPFPTVVLEAMSWGKPVIGSSACGSVEVRVRSGVNGEAFEAGDEAQLVAAIVKLASDPSYLRSASVAARKTAEEWPLERAVSLLRTGMDQLIG
jgi:glycosyltransferase involved in cell wall biosynthesis